MDKQLISLMLKLHNGAKCFLKVEFEFLLHLLFDEVVSKCLWNIESTLLIQISYQI